MRKPEPLLRAVSEFQLHGWERPAKRQRASVLYNDGICRPVEVLGWMRDRKHGWLLHLRWPDGHRDWRLHDDRYIHPV